MSDTTKKIVESSTFNLLTTYSGFILGILGTFFLARLITPEEWGFLILSLSFVSFAIYINTFFPPGAEGSIQYYIPYIQSNEGRDSYKLRRFILHVYKIRLFTLSFIFLTYLIIIFMTQYGTILFQISIIISPLILFNMLQNLNGALMSAFQKFKSLFLISTVNVLIYTFGLFLIFMIPTINTLIIVAYITLLGYIGAFIISILILFSLIPKKDDQITQTDKIPLRKEFFEIHRKYGLNLVIAGGFTQISTLIINLFFLNSGNVVFITYISICNYAVIFALNFSTTDTSSYTSIFTEINNQNENEDFISTFYRLSKYLLLFVCFIIALMFFYIEIYISIVLSETYLIIILAIQIFIFTAIPRTLMRNLSIIIFSTNNTKINTYVVIFQSILDILFTIIGLLFLNFYLLIVLYLIVPYLVTLMEFYLINKKTKLTLKFSIVMKPVFIFLVSFLITLIVTLPINIEFFSNNELLNVLINGSIKFSIFIIIFYLTIYSTKYITKEEFNQIVIILPILSSKRKVIKKLVKLVERILPSDSNKSRIK